LRDIATKRDSFAYNADLFNLCCRLLADNPAKLFHDYMITTDAHKGSRFINHEIEYSPDRLSRIASV
ncbi:hypothetical protein, partial [Bacteroides heparinolyticus]|uniref:hypothetical protein n=1 Tax=Prevotella heparinolytica TaxID=28113 RepID=UPI00359FCFD5